jgi:hypothetical protein
MRNDYKSLVGISGGRRPFGILSCKERNNIELQETGF